MIYNHFPSESSLLLYINQIWGTVSSWQSTPALCPSWREISLQLCEFAAFHCKTNKNILRVFRRNCSEICKTILILDLSLPLKCLTCLDHCNFRQLTLLPCNLHSIFSLMQNFPLLQLGGEYPSFPDVDIRSRCQLKVFWDHMVWLMNLDWSREICLKSLRECGTSLTWEAF